MRKQPLVSPVLILWASFAMILVMAQGTTKAEPAADPTNAPAWSEPVLLSLDLRAERPFIATSPTSDKLVVVFIGRENSSVQPNDDNPYFLQSSNQGQTWTPAFPQPIYVNNTTQSLQVSAAIDPTGKAHAVWVENFALFYAHEDDWPVGISVLPTPISLVNDAPGAAEPAIVATSASVLDVVWSEGTGGTPPDLWHARSLDGGATWATVRGQITNTLARENFPSVIPDPNNANVLHVIWEAAQGNQSSIFYARGAYSGGSMTWSTPVQISPDDSKDHLPELTVQASGALAVVYAHVVPGGTIPGIEDDLQELNYVRCSQNCTQRSSWSAPQNVSGPPFLDVNENYPFYVFSTMFNVYGCDYVYFHGFEAATAVPFESISGTNRCANWKSGGMETITIPGLAHGLFPAASVHADGMAYLAYQAAEMSNGSVVSYPKVYFMRGQVPLPTFARFLPMIRRN